jgi:hypothetical protein
MVKCSECGYLAARNKDTRNLEEVEFKARQDGVLRTHRHEYMPVCFNMAVSFEEEVGRLRKVPEYATEKKDAYGQTTWPTVEHLIKIVLNEERECQSFTKWHQGSTPKEHREMLDRQEMLKWQADREDADRKWRTRQQWVMVIVAGIFTILGAILGGIIVLLAKVFPSFT